MSIQNISSSTAALNAQLAQQQQGTSSSFDTQSLPQLSTDQVQSLQQALQTDLQQALSGAAGNPAGYQTQLDNSVTNTLSQAGFSQSQIQTIVDKLNDQGTNGNAASQGHHGHHARRVLNGLVQALESNATGQSSTSGSAGSSSTGSGATSNATASGSTLLEEIENASSTGAGQSLDMLA
ncbi:MAG TPA: hypothetical protein VHC22_14330 [Pirellulales bacterium]|nr:hypothetical protein [Pirellulales bacterium]